MPRCRSPPKRTFRTRQMSGEGSSQSKGQTKKGIVMMRKTSNTRKTHRIAIAGVAAAAALGLTAVASPAFAAPACAPNSPGCVTGSVQVAQAITLTLTGVTFTVTGATPGTPYNAIPVTTANVAENDPAGFSLTTYMDDPAYSTAGDALTGPTTCTTDSFINSGDTVDIPDKSWTVTSSGPGGAGTPQAFAEQPDNGLYENGTCSSPLPDVVSPQALAIGSAGGVGSYNYTEQLAVTVPANTPAATYTGSLVYLATGK